MPFIRTVSLALVCFDKEIIPYGHIFCNKERGLQPTLCEPLGRENEGNEKNKTMVDRPAGVLFDSRHNANKRIGRIRDCKWDMRRKYDMGIRKQWTTHN